MAISARRRASVAGVGAPQAGTALTLVGAAVLAVSAWLPQTTPLGGTLWSEGTGWPMVAAAVGLAVLTLRAARRATVSWSGLWLGGLAVLDALAIDREAGYGSGPGAHLLGAGGLLVLAGWAVGFAARRPEIAGLGPWSGLAGRIRRARPAAAVATPGAAAVPWRWPLALYTLLAVVFWGLPVAAHMGSTLIAQNDIDPSIYTWFYAWWPHALGHGLNPFITHAIFVPEGYNLTWVTAVPLPSLLMTPVTLAFGPVVTYNVISVGAPALAAFTAFLLCRHVTGRLWPSLLGGAAFGFSPYMLRMLQGSPDLFFVALIPLLVLLVLRHLEGRARDRTLVLAGGVLVAAQFATCLELIVTATIFGAAALALAFALYPEHRAALLRTSGLLAGAYVLAAVLVSPILVEMVTQPHTTPDHNNPLLAADLASFVTPDPAVVAATTHDVTGAPGWYGGPAYVGLPLLALVGAFAWRYRRERVARLLAGAFVAPLVLCLGPRLSVATHETPVGLPWALVSHLPGLHTLIPQRFPNYAFLVGGVILAVWLARARRPAPWVLGVLAVAAFVPWVGSAAFKTPISDPPLFATGAYHRYLGPHDNVLTVPPIGENMRWQARDHFDFNLAAGGVGAFPDSYRSSPTFNTVLGGFLTPDYAAQLRRFVADKHVTAIVVDDRRGSPTWTKLFGSLGVRPLHTGGVLLYRLDRPGLKRSSGRSTR